MVKKYLTIPTASQAGKSSSRAKIRAMYSAMSMHHDVRVEFRKGA